MLIIGLESKIQSFKFQVFKSLKYLKYVQVGKHYVNVKLMLLTSSFNFLKYIFNQMLFCWHAPFLMSLSVKLHTPWFKFLCWEFQPGVLLHFLQSGTVLRL